MVPTYTYTVYRPTYVSMEFHKQVPITLSLNYRGIQIVLFTLLTLLDKSEKVPVPNKLPINFQQKPY